MPSIDRRAGTNSVKLIAVIADPANATNQIFLYSKVTDGVTQLFARSSDGTIHQITPPYFGTGNFGPGTDGTATMDGATNVAGMVPAGNVYTATRDYFFDNLTINTGISFKTVGFRVYVKTLLTLTGTGRIHFNGNSGGNAAGTVGGTPGAAVAAAVLAGSVAGITGGGGAGGATATAPRTFVSGAATAGAGGLAGAAGGNGGNGNVGQAGGDGGGGGHGAGVGGAGGAGGTVTNANVLNGDISVPQSAIAGRNAAGGIFTSGTSGGAGGNGGNSGSNQQGAGGGSGAPGGYLVVCARKIVGTGTIEANGGNGGNGANATGGNCGGGGAGAPGSGGIAIVYTGEVFPSAQVTVNGGTPGTPGTGIGTGGNGGNAGTAGAGFKIVETI